MTAESTEEPVVGLGLYPVWAKVAHNLVTGSSDFRIHELATVHQMYFDFQTPDQCNAGETAYTHGCANWDVTFFVMMNTAVAELVFDGKEEEMREGLI